MAAGGQRASGRRGIRRGAMGFEPPRARHRRSAAVIGCQTFRHGFGTEAGLTRTQGARSEIGASLRQASPRTINCKDSFETVTA